MSLDEFREIDIQKDVSVVHEKGAARKKGFRILERAAGPQDRVLGKEGNAVLPGRSRGPRPDQLRFPVKVDADPVVTDCRKSLDDDLDQWP